MKVNIKEMNVGMELKTKGMELELRDTKDVFLGDFVINKTGITWCRGKITPKNGVKKNWAEVIRFFEDNVQES